MQTQNPFLDGLARLMTDAAGAANGVREEADLVMRRQVERWISDLDYVPREEFETVKEMAAEARTENEALRAEIDALKARFEAAE